jgi:hypothetical protein
MLNYIDAAGNTYVIFFNDQGLPAKVIDEQGTTIELEYVSSNISPQVSSENLALDDGLTSYSSVSASVTTHSGDVPFGVQTSVEFDEPLVVSLDQAIVDENLMEPTGNVNINVAKCDEPVNPNGKVMVNFRGLSSSFSQRYPAYPTSEPGRFVSWIPQRTPDPIPATLEEICTAFADKIDAVCKVFNPVAAGPGAILLANPGFQAALCGEITIAVSLAATPAAGATAGAVCGALLIGGTITCNTLGWSFPWLPPIPESQNITQQLCGQVEEALNSFDSALGLDKVVIQAVADFSEGMAAIGAPGENTGVFASEEKEVMAIGPFPDLNINALVPTIDNFTAPFSPEYGEGYTATADLSCVLGADMSILVSRDGSPLTAETGFGTTQKDSISVDVPADPSGKVDILEVSALNVATNKSVSKKFSVVFKVPPTIVIVTATDSAAAEPSDTGAFTITRTGNISEELTVYFAFTGSAAQDADYVASSAVNTTSITIPADAESAVVIITPINDEDEEDPETVTMTINENSAYTVGASSAATVNIEDDDEEYIFGEHSCPASLSAKLRWDGSLVTLPFSYYEDNWFMDEADCYYHWYGYNFNAGIWLNYGQSSGACGQGSGENFIITSWPDGYGDLFVRVSSTLRTIDVTFLASDSYYEYQNYEPALIEFLENAVKGKMGLACQ